MIGGFEKTGFNINHLLLGIFTAFRFDTLAACAGLSPLAAFAVIEIITPSNIAINKIKSFLFKTYIPFIAFMYVAISVINLYFYKFFQTHISILVFGFIYDDTKALLHTFWHDYPVVKITLSLIITPLIFYFTTKYLLKKKPLITLQNKILIFVFPFLFSGTYILGIRGSVTDHPLRMEATSITTNEYINLLTCNGIYALKNAISNKKKNRVTINIDETLHKAGFTSINELANSYIGNSNIIEDSNNNMNKAFFSSTPTNHFLEENPPNVIFILAESMSSYYINLHNNDSFNLLGELEDVWHECIVFDRFLASTPSTLGSVENIVTGTVKYALSESPYFNSKINTSVAKAFTDEGYNASFVTGGKLSWRNSGDFLSYQYFSQTLGYASIYEKTNFREKHEFGAHDEYLFKYIADMLLSNNSQPQFIFALTISNHTPYVVPSHYQQYPLKIPNNLSSIMQSSESYTNRSLLSFQYSNDQIGKFIKTIKNSPLANNTIIAITGDHNIRKIVDFPNEQLLNKHGVPFILWIPEKYKPTNYDTSHFGSHKDIFPTLFNLSLSNAQYLKTGVNLFNKEEASNNFAVSEYNIFMNSYGCVTTSNGDNFYKWANDEKNQLTQVTPCEELLLLKQRGITQVTAMDIAVQLSLKANIQE